MKKSSMFTACLGVSLLASSAFAAVINVNPGDNVASKIKNAQNGDTVKIAAGVYNNVSQITTTANITVVGVPFENSQDPADIDQVVLKLDNSADNWIPRGKTTIRGIKFEGGDHQIVAENEVLIEHCIFVDGDDQVSFNKPGYGTVRYCEFYFSADDGIDMDSNAAADGAYFDIHNNLFEQPREDGIEFRTYKRSRYNTIMPVEIHHNTFIKCGTDTAAEGGDSLQIIDQEMDGNVHREILVYNNVMDGQGQTRGGVSCNDKNDQGSDAQLEHTGARRLNTPIWIYNNTIVDHKGTGIAASKASWAFNNIIKNCGWGFARVEAQNNIISGVANNKIWMTAAVDAGGNIVADPVLDADLAPDVGSPAIDAGLTSLTVGGKTIQPEHNDIGALQPGTPYTGPLFDTSTLFKPAAEQDVVYSASIANDASDPDGDAMTFDVVSGPAWLAVAPNGALSGTPGAADVGNNEWEVEVTAVDGRDTAVLKIEVFGAPEPIDANAGPDSTNTAVGTSASVKLDASASAGNIVEYVWLDENGAPITSGMVKEQEFDIGVHVVTLRVKDTNGDFDTDEVIITVVANSTGVVAPEDFEVETPVGVPASVTLTAVGTGDIVDYIWKENGVRIGEGETITVELAEGVHTIMVRVKDTNGVVARDWVVVTVKGIIVEPNEDPYFGNTTILSTRTRVGRLFEKDISGKGKDPDGDKLTWSISGPNWLSITPDGILRGTPAQGDKGRNEFTVKVDDGRGGTATALVKIRVR